MYCFPLVLASERRRRDEINECIDDLYALLPNGSGRKPNKNVILRRAIHHIRMMADRVSFLEDHLRRKDEEIRTLIYNQRQRTA